MQAGILSYQPPPTVGVGEKGDRFQSFLIAVCMCVCGVCVVCVRPYQKEKTKEIKEDKEKTKE